MNIISSEKLKKAFSKSLNLSMEKEGFVFEVRGPKIIGTFPNATIGEDVLIERNNFTQCSKYLPARVVAFSNQDIVFAPFETTECLSPGDRIISLKKNNCFLDNVESLLGFALDATGEKIFKLSDQSSENIKNLKAYSKKLEKNNSSSYSPIPFYERSESYKPFLTGIKSLDLFTPMALGQRVGIFAEPGVGKTSLVSMAVNNSDSDVSVIALIGERGREAKEFVDKNIPKEKLKNTVIVVSTSDQSAILRKEAGLTALLIAEQFRLRSLNVLLIFDSLTRYFRALREIGLNRGESAVRKGYPPSCFDELPKLIEKAGDFKIGSITAFFTILLSSEIDEDPLADEVKGLLDGHIYLTKELSERGQLPALSITKSLSRLESKVLTRTQLQILKKIRAAISELNSQRDIIAFERETSEKIKNLLKLDLDLMKLLNQNFDEKADSNIDDLWIKLEEISKNF